MVQGWKHGFCHGTPTGHREAWNGVCPCHLAETGGREGSGGDIFIDGDSLSGISGIDPDACGDGSVGDIRGDGCKVRPPGRPEGHGRDRRGG